MRLIQLNLDRYGPFTGTKIEFSPSAKLHIVFGRNEAGKSCSLAAVTDLLFGIERQTRFDFLHSGKEMRIGAALCARSGEHLEFWRRKNRPVLTDSSDAVLPDDALSGLLGGVSRDVFRRAFGLDAESLRRSGEDLKKSDGELGAALFSAASGLRGFSELKVALEFEADGIFAERKAQYRRFYQALERFEAARKNLREHETRGGDLKKLQNRIDELDKRLGQLTERRASFGGRRAEIERLRRARPIIRSIDAELERLTTLGSLPKAPEGFGNTLIEAITRNANAAFKVAEARAAEDRQRGERDAINVEEGSLNCAAEIESIAVELGAYRTAMRDLPRVQADFDGANAELTDLAVRLGFSDSEALLAAPPDDASRAIVAQLIEQGRQAQREQDARKAELETESKLLADKRQARVGTGVVRDPRQFRERLAALAPSRKLAGQVDVDRPVVAAALAELAESCARLSLSLEDLDRLASESVPMRETIAEFAARFALIEEEIRAEEQKATAAQQDAETLAGELEVLAAGGDVPSRERIVELRSERDAIWQDLRPALFGQTAPSAEIADSVAGLEIATRRADDLADLALADATRVATYAETTRRLTFQESLRTKIQSRLAALTEKRASVQKDWVLAWSASKIVPEMPSAMQAWRIQFETLVEQRVALRQRQSQMDLQSEQVVAAYPAFVALGAELDLLGIPELDVAELAARIENEIIRLADAWEDARDSETIVADLERRVAVAREKAGATDAVVRSWAEAFARALPRIGLPCSATLVEAEAVLEAWKQVPALAANRASLQRRVAGMKRDRAGFEERLRNLCELVAADLVGLDAERAMAALSERLRVARTAQTRYEGRNRQLDDAVAATRMAVDASTAAASEVARLAERNGLPVDQLLEPLAQRMAERDAALAALRDRREQLANASDGHDEAVLRNDLLSFDADQADGELVRIGEMERQLELESQETFAELRDIRARFDALDTNVVAEVALQQRRSAEAELLEAARDWAVLRVSALMVGTAIERQRTGQQEPLMRRAGELFSLLTGNAYVGLGQRYDDDDVPHLIGRRAEGSGVAVTDLSEGTRDQLYLALRLAYVEDYATRAEPPPFLGDDIFASSDDERTLFGLRALSAISGSVQPILFTHHAAVVETARREFGVAADIIELG